MIIRSLTHFFSQFFDMDQLTTELWHKMCLSFFYLHKKGKINKEKQI